VTDWNDKEPKRDDVTETALELAETFIQLGADVNAEDKEGNLSNFIDLGYNIQ
jgi:hypothetical protein